VDEVLRRLRAEIAARRAESDGDAAATAEVSAP
jgi:hypothetical protein